MDGYIAFLHPPEDASAWGVTFPDVPGCVSAGSTLEEAAIAAREALSGHIAALIADGDAIPAPRSWREIADDEAASTDAAGAFVQFVVPRRVSAERVRVNIMIDKGLLRRTDEAAEARGWTRSAFIEAALGDKVEG